MQSAMRNAITGQQYAIPHGGAAAYSVKSIDYMRRNRADYVAELPINPTTKILEIGCGCGETGALALSEGRCGSYSGVEICAASAECAKTKLTEVIVGDVETLDLPWASATFDALIVSEVLEHLIDPWSALRRLRPLLKVGGSVFASSPNVSHYRVLVMRARGEWTLTDAGVMDRTHLRWFTPKTYRELFESSGYRVDSVKALGALGTKARLASFLSRGCMQHLLIRQMDLRAHCE